MRIKSMCAFIVMVMVIVGGVMGLWYVGSGIGEMVMWGCITFVMWIMWENREME